MKLSTRSIYGMRALVELALAGSRRPVSAASIAKRQELSVAYLEQLLHRLRREGIITSVRGPRGGYVLARHPNQITMASVVSILDGSGVDAAKDRRRSAAANGTARNGAGRAALKDGHRHAHRIAQAVWRCVHERLTQALEAVTLQDLCETVRTEAGEPLDHRYVFHI